MTDFTTKHYAPRTYEKMQEVLMDPTAPGPEIQYHMVRGGSEQRNITIWEPGIVGGEYIKTYGHYHVGKLDETYWIIFGEGIAILQKRAVAENGNPIDDEIEQVFAVHVKPGDHIYIPSEWGHLVVNISKTYFVTADDSPVNFDEANPVSMPGHADYEAVKKMQGFCYYVVEENGQPILVKNPKYKKVPDIQIIEASSYPLKKE
ncbi:MAG TPA: glucose-6-phosphate isomerase family protein [Patescibacteria group bacterium]|jgi:glucose-6-phosphate isomerase|nr:glucose-6-phosphate isomerase family protein [Patescibacteria group bacterium]